MRLTEGADGTTDALVYGFLMSVCDPGSGALHTVDDAGIRDRLAGSGLIDSAGRPTEQAYDLYRSIPVRHLGTVGIGDAFLTAVRMIGYDDGEEHDSFVTGSGLIVANVLDGTVEIVGTEDTDVACTIGRMIGMDGAEEGDLVLSALADEPSESYKLAVSVALKAVRALEWPSHGGTSRDLHHRPVHRSANAYHSVTDTSRHEADRRRGHVLRGTPRKRHVLHR